MDYCKSTVKFFVVCSILLASLCAPDWAAQPFTPPAEGSKVDVREGDAWTTVTFIRKEGRKLLIRYDDGTEEWIFPDRLRTAGAQLSTTQPQSLTNTPQIHVQAGADDRPQAAAAPLDIKGPVTPLDFDKAVDPHPLPKGTLFALPTTQPAADFSAQPVNRRNTDFGNSIDHVVPCAGNPSIVVVSCGTVFATAPEVICLDLNAKRTLPIHGSTTKGQQVISAADAGRVLLSIIGMGWEPQIHLWHHDGQHYQLMANYDPFNDQGGHGHGLALARLIDATHAIFSANSGETYLVDLANNKAIGFIKGSGNAKPFVSPGGEVLGVITDDAVVQLIRTSDFATIAQINNAATRGSVTIDRSGTLVAYPGADGDLHVAKISDGSDIGTLPALGQRNSRIDLLDGGLVLVDQKTLYDLKTKLPVWIYNRPFGNMDPLMVLPDGRFAMLAGGGGGSVACAVSLPDSSAKNAAATVTKDKFILSPGTPIYVTGDLDGFGPDKAAARQVIANQLQAAKLSISSDAGAAVHAVVKVAPGANEQRVFRMSGDQKLKIVECPSTIVTVSLECDSQSIWSQAFTFKAGTPVQLKEGQTLNDAVKEAALPQANQLASLAFPTYLVKGANGVIDQSLGGTDITSTGLVPSSKSSSSRFMRHPRGPLPQPPTTPPTPPQQPSKPDDSKPVDLPGQRA